MADRMGPIRYLNVNENTAASNVLVAGATGERVLLVNMTLITAGAVAVTIEDTDGTDRIGPLNFAANGGISMPDSRVGWCRTGSGQGLNILLGGGVQVAGSIAYRMMPDHFEF